VRKGWQVAKDFRELRVWEASMVLAENVYQLAASFPAEERYGLSAQIKRAAVSIPSCIAEGNARVTRPDYLRFLSMAAGSLAEVLTQCLLAQRLGFGDPVSIQRCLDQHSVVTKLLKALQTGLRPADGEATATRPSPFPIPHSRPRS